MLRNVLCRPVWTARKFVRYISPQAVYLGNNNVLTRTLLGHKLLLDTRDISLTPHILLDGLWEEGTTRFLIKRLVSGMVYVEIGVNIGYYAVLAASRVGSTGRVVGFEANPALAQIASRNLHINGFDSFSTIYPAAVADRCGEITLFTHESFKGSSTTVEGVLTNIPILEVANQPCQSSLTVPVVKLDDVLHEIKHIDFLKMDIEGGEPAAMRGMQHLINSNPQIEIVMEFSPQMLRTGGHDPVEVLESMKQRGFSLFLISSSGKPIKFSSNELAAVQREVDIYLRRDC